MSKSETLEKSMRNRMNGNRNQDAFDTGEDSALLAKLQALRQGKPQQQAALLAKEEIRIGALIWKPTGLVLDGELTRDDWEQTGNLLKQIDSSLQWLIGDLIVYGEDLSWGDQKQIAEAFGFEYSTIRNYAYVSRNVEMSIRSDKLSFGHHQVVASLNLNDQVYWLDKAAEGNWSIKRLSEELKQVEKKESLPKYLQPLRALRHAYSPKRWATMTKREQHRVFSELKGYLAYMADQMGETLDFEKEGDDEQS